MKNERLQRTIDLLKRCGEAKGMTITEEFSALSDRLREANAELLKNVRTVSSSSVHEVKMPLSVELDWEELEDE
jgi:hypothetical protein